jgi:transposase
MHFFYRSKKMYNNFVHVFLLVYKERLNVSYRRFVQIASESLLQRTLCIKRIPHFTTLQKFMQKLDKRLFEKMVRACRKLLRLKDIEASVDGTGFSNTNPSHYYLKRIDGQIAKNYTKTVFLADNKTKLILNVKTHSDNSNESLDFIPLLRELSRALRTVLADKQYDSMKNRLFCRDRSIEVHIPFRQYPQSLHQEFGKPSKRKLLEREFDSEKYRRRSLIESVNSAIKRTLGSYVCSRRADNQQKQVTIKALAYNLEVIGKRITLTLFIS